MLLDSNIIIYSVLPEHGALRRLIAEHEPAVSSISYVEVLGYHHLEKRQIQSFEDIFAVLPILPVTEDVLDLATRLRQQRRMSLGDSLIAGTAILHGLTLVTGNSRDFVWIDQLDVVNPVI